MNRQRFSYEELGSFCLSLAHLLRGGLHTGDALALMAQDETDPRRKTLFQDLSARADEGEGLSQLLSHPAFPGYVRTMAEAGEETGRLEESLFSLASYYDGRARLERQLKAALLQPLVLLGVLLVVLAALLVWVLPVFDDVYRQLGSSLTGVAGGLLTLGRVLRSCAPVLGALAAAAALVLVWLFRSQRGRIALLSLGDRWGLFAQADAAKLTLVLSMALNSGLDGERAMELAMDLSPQGTPFHTQCQTCLDKLADLASLPQALRESKLLPAADCRLLEAGYHGGCPDTVMTQLASRVEERSQAQIDRWLGRVEPALVLTASLLVGAVLLSVLLPLTRIMAAIG